jgi:hypothetical protein
MAITQYDLTGSSADGNLIITNMSSTELGGLVSICFFSDAALTTPVTPTAGVVTISVSEDGCNYGSVVNNVVSAADVGPSSSYHRPRWSGSTRYLKASFAGVTGADFVRLVISREREQ